MEKSTTTQTQSGAAHTLRSTDEVLERVRRSAARIERGRANGLIASILAGQAGTGTPIAITIVAQTRDAATAVAGAQAVETVRSFIAGRWAHEGATGEARRFDALEETQRQRVHLARWAVRELPAGAQPEEIAHARAHDDEPPEGGPGDWMRVSDGKAFHTRHSATTRHAAHAYVSVTEASDGAWTAWGSVDAGGHDPKGRLVVDIDPGDGGPETNIARIERAAVPCLRAMWPQATPSEAIERTEGAFAWNAGTVPVRALEAGREAAETEEFALRCGMLPPEIGPVVEALREGWRKPATLGGALPGSGAVYEGLDKATLRALSDEAYPLDAATVDEIMGSIARGLDWHGGEVEPRHPMRSTRAIWARTGDGALQLASARIREALEWGAPAPGRERIGYEAREKALERIERAAEYEIPDIGPDSEHARLRTQLLMLCGQGESALEETVRRVERAGLAAFTEMGVEPPGGGTGTAHADGLCRALRERPEPSAKKLAQALTRALAQARWRAGRNR